MKIYFAGPEPFDIQFSPTMAVLLSYYDITDGPLPFRKETWKFLVKVNRGGTDENLSGIYSPK